MMLSIIIFVSPLIGYAIFFYLIIRNARRSAKRWREEMKEEALLLKEAIRELRLARERLEKQVSGEALPSQILTPQSMSSYLFPEYPKRKRNYYKPIFAFAR